MFSGEKEHAQDEVHTSPGRIKTVEAFISGRVQGVGFRACVKKLASGLCITGEVMNLDDGRVYILATGESVIIEKMLSSLYECPRAHVREIKSREISLRNFDQFAIVRGI